MILSAHQPQFMPWLGYFDKMRSCDLFVLLDSVQYKRNEWQNRNRILTTQGPQWLTVPVLHTFGQRIDETLLNNTTNWKRKHLHTLAQNYGRAEGFAKLMPRIEKMYAPNHEVLSQVNLASLRLLAEELRVTTRQVLLSENEVEGSASLRLVNLCKKFGTDTYLAGAGGMDYMDMTLFAQAGIKVIFQDYRHPVYRQRGPEFTPNLSALDLVFHTGTAAAQIY